MTDLGCLGQRDANACGMTIALRLEHHARARPDGRAFSFLEDGDGVNTRT